MSYLGRNKQFWNHLTTAELSALAPQDTLMILPWGAIEQHGPHLPLDTDIRILRGLIDRLSWDGHSSGQLVVLPEWSMGISDEHVDYSGTITIPLEAVLMLAFSLGQTLQRQKFNKLLILNGHGGNSGIMPYLARKLKIDHGVTTYYTSWMRLANKHNWVDASEREHGFHGGIMETSVMLALYPEMVKADHMKNRKTSKVPSDTTKKSMLSFSGPHSWGWMISELHPSGVCGQIEESSAELGNQVVDFVLGELRDLIDEIFLKN